MIYLDNNATTKLDPRVLEVMMPYLTEEYGNAASNHAFGVSINSSVQTAREQISELVNCAPTDLIFTSGATEAINLAIKGLAKENQQRGNHIITCETEHPAVLDTCRALEADGFQVSYLPVQPNGLINIELIREAITPSTILVSVMLVNNETGVIQPVKEISEICHSNGVFFMTDATQAVGKMPVDVNDLGVDLMVFSGHKFYGAKGVGALYLRSRRPFKVKLNPLVHGGGHERGLRSGTLNVPGIVGLGQAAFFAKAELQKNARDVQELRDFIESSLLTIDESVINGDISNRLYNVSNIRFKGVDADAIIVGLKEIMISNGSACSSAKVEPSHVLKAMGLTDEECYSSIRISIGKYNSKDEIIEAIKELQETITQLRKMNTSILN